MEAEANTPFLYFVVTGGDSEGVLRVREDAVGGGVGVSLADNESEAVRRVVVSGVFTRNAHVDQVFKATVLPLCHRVAAQHGAKNCCVIVINKDGPPLLSDQGLAPLVLNSLCRLTGTDNRPGCIRVALSCFLNDPTRPTDLLKNVQQKVPDDMQWPGETESELSGRRFVFAASPSSVLKTLQAVLHAPSLTELLPQLSYALTFALKKT
ncbi:hypothetical protein DIPPA_07765a, partial [Diplonema papillatum]